MKNINNIIFFFNSCNMFVKYSNFVDNFLIGQSLASKLVVALLNKINITTYFDNLTIELYVIYVFNTHVI